MSTGSLVTLIGTLGLYALGVACAVHALMTKTRVSASAIAWIFVCLTLPLIGVLLYLTIGQNHVEQKRIRSVRRARAAYRAKAPGGRPWDAPVARPELKVAVERVAEAPLIEGNDFAFYIDGEEAYPAMLEAAAAAKQTLCAQYYIFDGDAAGKDFRDMLARKAAEGVEVRLLYDAVGCFGTYDGFWDPIIEAGGKVEAFMPFRLLKRRWQINLRNHRKLLAIDGEVAFTGSMNIGGRHNCGSSGQGRSHDLNVRIRGPAVGHLLEVFASDWFFASNEDLSHSKIFVEARRYGATAIQVVASGPDEEHGSFHLALLAALSQARRSVTLVTPYFIPDPSVMDVLVLIARRGVDLKIVVPERPDSILARLASRDHVRTIVNAGGQVFERPGPMIHMKLALIDDSPALLGTSNLDNRSFFLNFECDLVVHDREFSEKLREIVAREIAQSRRLSPFQDLDDPAIKRVAYRVGALFSPIL